LHLDYFRGLLSLSPAQLDCLPLRQSTCQSSQPSRRARAISRQKRTASAAPKMTASGAAPVLEQVRRASPRGLRQRSPYANFRPTAAGRGPGRRKPSAPFPRKTHARAAQKYRLQHPPFAAVGFVRDGKPAARRRSLLSARRFGVVAALLCLQGRTQG